MVKMYNEEDVQNYKIQGTFIKSRLRAMLLPASTSAMSRHHVDLSRGDCAKGAG